MMLDIWKPHTTCETSTHPHVMIVLREAGYVHEAERINIYGAMTRFKEALRHRSQIYSNRRKTPQLLVCTRTRPSILRRIVEVGGIETEDLLLDIKVVCIWHRSVSQAVEAEKQGLV